MNLQRFAFVATSALILGCLVGGIASADTVVNYTVSGPWNGGYYPTSDPGDFISTSGTDSWTGSFTIPDMNATVISGTGGLGSGGLPTSIIVSTGTFNFTTVPEEFDPVYPRGLVEWRTNSLPDYFDLKSTDFQTFVNNGHTWSDVVNNGAFNFVSLDYVKGDSNLGDGGASASFGTITFFTAVPEPSTYAMALAGLGFTGYSMFRRRKRA